MKKLLYAILIAVFVFGAFVMQRAQAASDAIPAAGKHCVKLDWDFAHLHLEACVTPYAGAKGVYVKVYVKAFGGSKTFTFDIVKNGCFNVNPLKIVGNIKYCITEFKKVNTKNPVGYKIDFDNQIKFCLSYVVNENCKGTDKWHTTMKFP